MTINEIRLVKALVEDARSVMSLANPNLLKTYDAFVLAMSPPNDAALKTWGVTRKQFRKCLSAAFQELTRSNLP